MCGIYGITARDPEFINQYINKCKHRGPDGRGTWGDDTVTLGHNLLSIMAKPNMSTQPWITPKENILVYNGEIFNYYELKTKYKQFIDTTGCDTELLAWGLDTFGLDFIDEIDSMHGFAYYEQKKKQITLSRDHAGIKPLYYAETKEGLVFGSEIKGMLDKVPDSRTMDKLAVSCMSMTGINALRNTFFSGIKKLLAGETIVYDIASKKITTTKRIYIKPNSNKKFDPEEFREMASKTVKMCSIGRREIGVFLSGGLDSCLVAYELQKIIPELKTFTNRIAHDWGASSENYNNDADVASTFANDMGFKHTEVPIKPEQIEKIWDDSIYYMEQPVYNPSQSMYCHTNKFLSEKGIVVTMAGDMGDEILGGYPKYWKMKKEKFTSWSDIIDKWIHRIKRPLKLHNLLIDKETLRNELIKCYPDDLWNPKDPVGSYMALDCVAQVPEEFFMRNDQYGMAYGMEGRFPLATKTFMQYCMNIHSDEKIGVNKNDTKMLTKIAYKEKIHSRVLTKKKTGWTVPLLNWMKMGKLKHLKVTEDIRVASQGTGKATVPALIVKDWKKTYQVKEY